MKLVPGHLPPIPTSTASMERLPLPLPFSPDLLWRYPLGFPSLSHPSSPLLDYKSQLPSSLASDPRVWSREDVAIFLRWAEREFDLQPIDMDKFQINGKAMCLLTRTDLSERAPGSGDVLHNVLQILLREANNFQRMLPSSPVTPTSRHPYPLSPHSHPPTPNWNILSQNNDSAFHSTQAATLAAHLMAQSNSVTLSPAPSVDSQSGSPQHADMQQTFGHSIFNVNGSNGSGSNPSDSDEDLDAKNGYVSSPPNTPSYLHGHNPQMQVLTPRSPKLEGVSSPGAFKREFFGGEGLSSPGAFKREFFGNEPSPGMYKREFFANDASEPSTNGRLLWDFLQQLLNDPAQRYTNFIAWKNSETGVFKIVDPAGLAKLWGIQKNHLSMNYDKMSRALRYYYRVNILRKVQGERHCYQFLRNPTELRNIKNISLLRQRMETKPQIQIIPQITIKREFIETQKPEGANDMHHQPLPTSTEMDHVEIIPQKINSPKHLEHPYEQLQKSESQNEIKSENMPWKHQNMSGKSGTVVWKNENMTVECDEMPTDLSIDGPTDLSSNSSRHVSIVCSPDPPISTTDH